MCNVALATTRLSHPFSLFCPSQVADVGTGNGQSGALQAPVLPVPYPPAGSPHPQLAPCSPSGFMWTFPAGAAGRESAQHFIGELQTLNPGEEAQCRHVCVGGGGGWGGRGPWLHNGVPLHGLSHPCWSFCGTGCGEGQWHECRLGPRQAS